MKYRITDAHGTREVFGNSAEEVARWGKCVWEERGITVEHLLYDETFDAYLRRVIQEKLSFERGELKRLAGVYGEHVRQVGAKHTLIHHIANLEALLATVGVPLAKLDRKTRWFHEAQYKHYLYGVRRMCERNLMAVAPEVLADVDPELLREHRVLAKCIKDDPSLAPVFALSV